MRIHKLNRWASSSPASATHKRTRRILLVCAGTLALVLATMGAVVALSGQSRAPKAQERPAAARPSATSASPQGSDDHGATKGAGSTNSTAGPVLADGTYPTYIKKVDIESATITVDVIQVFLDEAAASAAVEDGVDPSEAPFIYVYVRNQNPCCAASQWHPAWRSGSSTPATRLQGRPPPSPSWPSGPRRSTRRTTTTSP